MSKEIKDLFERTVQELEDAITEAKRLDAVSYTVDLDVIKSTVFLLRRLRESLDTIDKVIEGNAPMSKWNRNVAVGTFEDLEWWVKTQLTQCLQLQARADLGKNELGDWCLGKQAAFDAVLQNIHQIKERNGQ